MITGFRLVGVEGIEVSTVDEAKVALSKVLLDPEVAVIIISEDFSSKMREQIDRVRLGQITAVIVEIPTGRGSSGEISISDFISRTLGVRL